MATIENLYVGDGTTVLYSFTFPYIEEDDVKVSLDDVDTTEYSLANATTVEFVAAPANGVAIRIYRNTSVDNPKAVFYPGSAIRAQDLNDNFEQNLFVIQEADFNNTQSAADSKAALATAQAADTKADQANVQSAAAQASAAQAQTDATQAAADAATAQADATQAAANASAAQASADQANTAVQAAAIFTPVANVAAIPSSPADQDRVSVKDSTGIASFTPLTGLPVGPTYDSGVYVNLVYQTTGATWEFVAYGPNDPDSRYLLDTVNSVSTSNISSGAITTDKLDRAYVETAGGTMTGDLTVPKINDFVFLTAAEKLTAADSDSVVYEASTGALVLKSRAERTLIKSSSGSTTDAIQNSSLDPQKPGSVASSVQSNAVGFTQMQASCHGVFRPGRDSVGFQVGIFTFEWTGGSRGDFVGSEYMIWNGNESHGEQTFSFQGYYDIDPTKQYITQLGISKNGPSGTATPMQNTGLRVVYMK